MRSATPADSEAWLALRLSSPVGYLEGIFVVPDHRRSGVGEAPVGAAEAVGYEEAERIVCYRKSLEVA